MHILFLHPATRIAAKPTGVPDLWRRLQENWILSVISTRHFLSSNAAVPAPKLDLRNTIYSLICFAKRACDRQMPCRPCLMKNAPCSYERGSHPVPATPGTPDDNAMDLSYDFVDDAVLTTPLSSANLAGLECVDWDRSS